MKKYIYKAALWALVLQILGMFPSSLHYIQSYFKQLFAGQNDTHVYSQLFRPWVIGEEITSIMDTILQPSPTKKEKKRKRKIIFLNKQLSNN